MDGGIRLVDGEHSIVLRDDALEPLQEKYSMETCYVTYREGKVVVFFFDDIGIPGPLLYCDEATGKIEWIAEVWALGKYVGGTSGAWPMRVSVELAGNDKDKVVVWGSGVFGNYLEVLDARSGKCDYRFCTNYWHAWNGE